MERITDLREAALSYAAFGLRVFPCRPRAKEPATEHGFKDASADGAQVREWWSRDPCNIGLATGGGIVVIDLDEHPERGESGSAALSMLEKMYGPVPETVTSRTGNGGEHRFFSCVDQRVHIGQDLDTRAHKGDDRVLPKGIDWRGNGGYVVAPPSVHPITGKPYKWVPGHAPGEMPFAELPSWMLDIIVADQCRPTSGGGTMEAESTGGLPETVDEGGRNRFLFERAAGLRDRGFSFDEIYGAISVMNEQRCSPPLDNGEVQTICRSACRYDPDPLGGWGMAKSTGKISAPSTLPIKAEDFFGCFKPLTEFEEREAEWVIPGWMPRSQITLIAADGGIGKTTLWCDILAALSRGGRCLLDPPDLMRPSLRVAFCTTEDSVGQKLKKKLRVAGANMENIIAMDPGAGANGELRGFKFGTPLMADFVRHFKPDVVVFDPVQGFIDREVNMGSRNAMRDCLAPLVSLGEELGTTFLIVVHTNKRKGASGRDRIADSADLWDIARSVWMAGFTENYGVRYLSNEKNNYSLLQQTLLFTIEEDGIVQPVGTSWKRDRDYQQEAQAAVAAPKRDDCRELLIKQLDAAGGQMLTKDLDTAIVQSGFSEHTLRRVKTSLKKEGIISFKCQAEGAGKAWVIQLCHTPDEAA